MAGQRNRILVIEDDTGIRRMLSLALGEAGHEVLAHDGRGTVEIRDADLVVMDVRLGERTAHDLIRAQPELAERPLIFMTAGSAGEILRDLPDAVVLRKPFDLTALEAAVAEAQRSAAAATGDASGARDASTGGDGRTVGERSPADA